MKKQELLLNELRKKVPSDPLRWYHLEAIVLDAFDDRGIATVNEFEFWDIVAFHSYWRIYVLLTEDGWEYYDGNYQNVARYKAHPPQGCRVIEHLNGRPYQFACKERIPS